ncbi:TKL protein kinase [Phytophthora nicotianae P10297]|uniref:TKL protein kinase n=1 Tax=Phytophthora nicotianae P10297 TaxID=1317064 RepID=W2ZME1_PHYNI|nr:TKL protein kinase [Phytophthora nicotianae P10297]
MNTYASRHGAEYRVILHKPLLRKELQVLLKLAVAGRIVSATDADKMYSIFSAYLGDKCDGTPYLVSVAEDNNCTTSSCVAFDTFGSRPINANMATSECSTDYLQTMRNKFGNSPYLIQLLYSDENCSSFIMGFGYPATGSCVGAYNESDSLYVIADLNDNGSALFQEFVERTCFSDQLYMTVYIDAETIANHSCDVNRFRWYSSNDVEAEHISGPTSMERAGNGLSTGGVIGIAVGVAALSAVLLIALLVYSRRLKHQTTEKQTTLNSTRKTALEAAIQGQSGLWTDNVITTKRVSRDEIVPQQLISKGAFGEVYAGVFNGRKVAVKMLLPASREKLHRVNEFLAEAKMTATMDHAHIVSFIGVAWDSLSDLCVVLEYMDGGELRTLLNKYEADDHPSGFDRQKLTIALHVCHALSYLHSMIPSIIHRDLKSRNILLDREMNAKLSDFGISRERLDRTMTAGVGTSLWMAPEVMLGERYGDKVDMFSFGVVLSELDVHTRPYARVKKENLDSNGREMTDSVLLQKVALGQIQVEFSKTSPKAVVELGQACISIDPTQRPSAAEALYRLQLLLRKVR